jgi:hypothetical protein
MSRPYGQIEGLPARLAEWVGRFKYDKTLPWAGLGVVADMEAVVRLLSLEEFGNWLHTHPDDELQRWGAEVLEAAGDRDALMAAIDEHLPDDDTYEGAVRKAGENNDAVRAVLVECGALAPDDTATPIPDLLRALLA